MKSAQIIWTIIGVIVLIGLTYFIVTYFNKNKTVTPATPVTQTGPIKRTVSPDGTVVPTAAELNAQLI